MTLLALLASCAADRPAPIDATGPVYALSVDVPFAELEVPDDNRPGGRAPPDRIPLEGWRLARVAEEGNTWQAVLPIRTRSMFYTSPPAGMQVLDADGRVIPHARSAGDGQASWTFDDRRLALVLPLDAPRPDDDAYTLSYPTATEREAALNLRWSGAESPEAFARATVQTSVESRTGLLLPAPGVAAWDLTVPPAAELSFSPGVAFPETVDGPLSDGATLVVEIEEGGETTRVWSGALEPDLFEPERVDLSRWAGRAVRLRMRTEPGESATFDYAFVGEPLLAPRKADPKRVVLVFVDTLRPDHLGTYGYGRATSPTLDAFAEGAVVFEQARSVAPWTLPTARSVLTGRHPEYYDLAETLQGRLRREGWATAMLAGNVYLSANFDLNRDWGLHRVTRWPPADAQVDQALAWLDAQEGRDALLLLHFMDAHLPYLEPAAYRHRFAGEAPAALGEEFHRPAVVRARLGEGEKQYVRDRYDNNVRFVDDALARLLGALDEDDVVVFFSDHGEEFWDHGAFEHGHTLYDEVLRVPLVIRAPGLAPSRVAEPVSLLDVVPTVLDALDLPAEGLDGQSLLPAARGEAGAREALASRALAFGRPLYGDERWGVLTGDHKYTTTEGRESLFDVAADPGEQVELFSRPDAEAGAPYRAAMAGALGREAIPLLRIAPSAATKRLEHDLVARITVPGGVRAAWAGDDPTNQSAAELELDGEELVIRWPKSHRGGREVYLLPARPLAEVGHELRFVLEEGPRRMTMAIPAIRDTAFGADRSPLAQTSTGSRRVVLGYGIAPLPAEGVRALRGDDEELQEMLREMGYTVGNE